MDKKTVIIIGIIVLVFAGLVGTTVWQHQSEPDRSAEETDFTQIIEPSEETGNLPENVTGNQDAPVLLFEYGDYQCTACAPMNPKINKLVEEYDGKLAVVFRTYIMPYHQNGTAAASAANAAAIQGYWKPYKDLLFANQDDWYYSGAVERQEQFEKYFEQASGGKGNMEQFRKDMASEEVSKKISFDTKLGDRVDLEWTPTFYLDGELMDQRNIGSDEFLDKLREKIDAMLAAKGIDLVK